MQNSSILEITCRSDREHSRSRGLMDHYRHQFEVWRNSSQHCAWPPYASVEYERSPTQKRHSLGLAPLRILLKEELEIHWASYAETYAKGQRRCRNLRSPQRIANSSLRTGGRMSAAWKL
jgi:hypothetical protein